jgi:gamma-glutamyltranspeptidase / glutathione hydrolase
MTCAAVSPRPLRRPSPPGISTAFPLATQAGIQILEEGGNAIDAAVAAAWALSVCEPSASGLGGQATLLVRDADGRTRVIDGHSHGPRLASEQNISPEQQQRGPRSCTIPSAPATLQFAHRKYGRLGWRRVLAPAISIAERGFCVTALLRKQIGWVRRWLQEDRAASAIFLRDGEAPRVGHVLCQPQLARTLRRIADEGADDFYRGRLAGEIAAGMRESGGLIDEEDLAGFAGPVQRSPISVRFRGLEVVSVPPPGGGVQLLLALKLLEQLLPSPAGASVEDWYGAVALSIYGAFQAREVSAARPGRRHPPLVADLLGEERVAMLAEALRRGLPQCTPAREQPGDTTHLTVADDEGNVVALTQSIQSVFGAKVVHEKLGFLYNNYLRTCPRHAHPSRLGPNCLSRSNAAPVLVLQDGRPVLALGSAGSRRITSSLLQVISNVVDRGMDLAQAVEAPRVHALLDGAAWLESRIAEPRLLALLRGSFSKSVIKGPFSFAMGAVHALQFLPGATLAAADPRRDGAGAVLPQRREVSS